MLPHALHQAEGYVSLLLHKLLSLLNQCYSKRLGNLGNFDSNNEIILVHKQNRVSRHITHSSVCFHHLVCNNLKSPLCRGNLCLTRTVNGTTFWDKTIIYHSPSHDLLTGTKLCIYHKFCYRTVGCLIFWLLLSKTWSAAGTAMLFLQVTTLLLHCADFKIENVQVLDCLVTNVDSLARWLCSGE